MNVQGNMPNKVNKILIKKWVDTLTRNKLTDGRKKS